MIVMDDDDMELPSLASGPGVGIKGRLSADDEQLV